MKTYNLLQTYCRALWLYFAALYVVQLVWKTVEIVTLQIADGKRHREGILDIM